MYFIKSVKLRSKREINSVDSCLNRVTYLLKVSGYLQMKNFVKNFYFWIIVRVFNVIFIRKKEKMEKSKYWRRNDGFFFEPEVKVTLLIDSPMVFFAGISMSGG